MSGDDGSHMSVCIVKTFPYLENKTNKKDIIKMGRPK